jgi:hypothetical protein|tara:strand:- start:710 stop:850 length:141 start_codon:yes stop_codon:yes gene_type:complete
MLHQVVACRQEFFHFAAGTLVSQVPLELHIHLKTLPSSKSVQELTS